MRHIPFLLLLAALFTGCVHAMDSGEVDRLTTCKNTDLAKIRKSLLLNGYEVKNASDVDLTTDWKQVAGYGRDRDLLRITVVKGEGTAWRFKVRRKSVRLEKENEQGMTVVQRDRRDHPTSSMTFDFSQPVEVVNEADQPYYKEREADYEEIQREVCGS